MKGTMKGRKRYGQKLRGVRWDTGLFSNERYGMCRTCRKFKTLRYSIETGGWWCSDCEPQWTIKNFMIKT